MSGDRDRAEIVVHRTVAPVHVGDVRVEHARIGDETDSADSGDGNPFLDEELTVVEPVVLFNYNLTDRTARVFPF